MTVLTDGSVLFRRTEHLLSALAGLGIEHAMIEVAGDTIPLLDGSAAPWVTAIDQVGCHPLSVRSQPLSLLAPVEVRTGDRWVSARAGDEFAVRYTLDYPGLPVQSLALVVDPKTYRSELAGARTFCGVHEARQVLGGGSPDGDQVVVFAGDGQPDRPLRFPDEAVRHKLLDLVGDLALAGAPLRGTFEARASGHALHIELARRLLGAAP